MLAVLRHLAWLHRWCRRHRRWSLLWLFLAALSWVSGAGSSALALTVGLVPGLLCTLWHAIDPGSYERFCAGPARRFGWRWRTRRRWASIAQACGLTTYETLSTYRDGKATTGHRTVAPRLRSVRTRGHVLELTIRARPGQTVEDLDAAAPRLASTLAAVAHRTRPISGAGSGCTAVVELVMADALISAVTAGEPDPIPAFERVRLGRAQGGSAWWLQVRGRHTLVAGCSGAGKGSVLWGICCGLAPAVRTDVVRLWGIDLKRGVELAMGTGLFTAHAYTPDHALDVLRALMRVIDERATRMAGSHRLHEPTVGDPLHVLVVDELAALTAYAEHSIRREAERLLSEILTQGRALGVVVVACVQDPRKDVVGMRGLFTQTVALRLRSSDETAMVLGDWMSRAAPAHRISPSHPGTAWVVEDTGAADRVRADFWPDDLIRDVSRRYATRVHSVVPPAESEPKRGPGAVVNDGESASSARPRSARKPRQPRGARSTVGSEDGAA